MIRPEIKAAIKELYVDKGYDVTEIAALTGVGATAIYEWVNASNWKDDRINKQFKLTQEQLAAIPVKENNKIALRAKVKALIFEKGYTQKQAAKEAGVSQKTVSQWSKNYKWKTKML